MHAGLGIKGMRSEHGCALRDGPDTLRSLADHEWCDFCWHFSDCSVRIPNDKIKQELYTLFLIRA